MKKIIVSIITFLILTETYGQSYIPFPTDSTVKWFYLLDSHSPSSPNCCYTYFTQTLIGDTIIGGESFSKLYNIEQAASNSTLLPFIGQTSFLPPAAAFSYSQDTIEQAFLHEDTNHRVSFYRVGNGPAPEGPYNAFDFSLQPGDTLTVGEMPVLFTVGAIDSVQTITEYRNRQLEQTDPNNYWIEGIGSVYYFPNQTTPFEGSCKLVGFMRNDTCIWGNCPWMNYSLTSIDEKTTAQKVEVFPNPVESFIHFTFGDNNWKTLSLFSADGKTAARMDVTGRTSVMLDISAYDHGFYFYMIESPDGKKATGKVIIQ